MTFAGKSEAAGGAAMRTRHGDLGLLLGTRRGLPGLVAGSWFWLRLDRKTRTLLRASRSHVAEECPAPRDVAKAAALLLAAGFARAALQLLLQFGLHRESADLMKMLGGVREAGKYYARACAWVLAEGCFQQVGDRAGVAYCIARQGRYADAAHAYEQVGDLLAAAHCHARAGDWQKAAQLYGAGGHRDASLRAYKTWVATAGGAPAAALPEPELAAVVELLTNVRFEPALLPLLARSGKLLPLLGAFLQRGRHEQAAQIYADYREDLGGPLVALVAGDHQLAEPALALCRASGDVATQARLHESLGRWGEAAAAFEQLGELDRASAACTRGGLWEKLAELKTNAGLLDGGATQRLLPNRGGAPVEHSVLSQPGLIGLESQLLAAPMSDPAASSAAAVFALGALAGEALDLDAGSDSTGIPDAFGAARFFDNLPVKDRQTLWGLGVVRRFNRAQVLVDFGDQPAGTFTVLDGDVKIFKRHATGAIEQVDLISKHGTFGESWSLLSLRADVRVVADSDCTVHVIERTTLGRALADDAAQTEPLFSRLACNLASHLVRRINPAAFTAPVVQKQRAATAA